MEADSAERLRRIVVTLARHLNTGATAEGLTPTQASVLGTVAGREPIGIAEIVLVERLNPTMLSRVLGKLEGMGLISRSAAAGDQRLVTVSVTDAGRALNLRLRDERTASVAQLVAQLDPDHQRQLQESLPALEMLAKAAAPPHAASTYRS